MEMNPAAWESSTKNGVQVQNWGVSWAKSLRYSVRDTIAESE